MTRRVGALLLPVAAIAALGSCAPFQDPQPSTQIEAVFPPKPSGAKLMDESFQDGKWRGDQPPPATSRRWLVDCADTDADVTAIEQYFLDEGFVEEVDPNYSVLRYRRPSDGFRAGVESEDDVDIVQSPNSEELNADEVAGSCVIWVTIEDSDYFDR